MDERVVGMVGTRPRRPGPDRELERDGDNRGAVILDERPFGARVDGPRRDPGC